MLRIDVFFVFTRTCAEYVSESLSKFEIKLVLSLGARGVNYATSVQIALYHAETKQSG